MARIILAGIGHRLSFLRPRLLEQLDDFGVTTASGIPDRVGQNYLESFRKLGCTNLHLMDIRRREESEDPSNVALIKKADCVMFSGGNQSSVALKVCSSPMSALA